MSQLTLKELQKCWNEGPFIYVREHDKELGWSVKNFKTNEVVAYGDKNICCGLAMLMNGYDQGIDLIKYMIKYFDK